MQRRSCDSHSNTSRILSLDQPKRQLKQSPLPAMVRSEAQPSVIPENHDSGDVRGGATVFLEDTEAWCRRVWKGDCDTYVAAEEPDAANDGGIVDSSQRSWMHPWTQFCLIITHEKKARSHCNYFVSP